MRILIEKKANKLIKDLNSSWMKRMLEQYKFKIEAIETRNEKLKESYNEMEEFF